jgi:hypothetical protein
MNTYKEVTRHFPVHCPRYVSSSYKQGILKTNINRSVDNAVGIVSWIGVEQLIIQAILVFPARAQDSYFLRSL